MHHKYTVKMNKLVLLLIGISIALCNAEGETKAAPQERIVGGIVVPNIASAPHTVSVQLWDNRNAAARGHRCGGALVSTRHVVTIARCVVSINGNSWVANNPNMYRVFSGHLNLQQANVNANNRRISLNFVHPQFQPITFFNDIAVLVTNTAFVLGTNRQLIPIRILFPQQGVPCQFTGWGGLTQTLISMQMRMMTATTIDNFGCGQIYNHTNIVNIGMVGNGNLCANNLMGNAPCDFDLGGPLICGNELYGLLSWASHCNSMPGSPFVFTRIDFYANWIHQIMATSDASTVHIVSFLLPIVALYHFFHNTKLN